MTSSPTFDLRLVAYTPLGKRGAIIPDSGFTVTATESGPTLQAQVSAAVYGTLPTDLEVAVEWWRPLQDDAGNAATDRGDGTGLVPGSTDTGDGTGAGASFFRELVDGTGAIREVTPSGAWIEGRDCRFAVSVMDDDDRDETKIVELTGLGIGSYLLAGATLASVQPYQADGNVEAARAKTAVKVNGKTFTWGTNVLDDGDRVRIKAKGSAKNLETGDEYYVRNPTSTTFQLSATPTGAIKDCGKASNVSMERVRTRIVFGANHKFTRSQAISVLNADGSNLTDGTQYYVTTPTPRTIQVVDAPGGIPIELKADALTVYRYLDGQRIFTNASPGQVLGDPFTEARDRGWAEGADGDAGALAKAWTAQADSSGTAWTTMADDPETPDVSIGFQPGTPLTQVLSTLLQNRYAEWFTAGRNVYLLNPGTGEDHTLDATPKRIGTAAVSVKRNVDLLGLRNAVTVRGTGPVLVERTATPGAWGRLETYETASGATSNTLAGKQAATDLAAFKDPAVAYVVTEAAQEAAWLPMAHYARGDWVSCQLRGPGWSRMRCVGWAFEKKTGGEITVSTYLEKVQKGLIKKITERTVGSVAGIPTTSTGQPLLESDNRKATYPLGLQASSVGTFATDGSAVATITVSWLPVTTDIDGADIQAAEYDVWIRPEGKAHGQSVGIGTGVLRDIGVWPSGKTYAITVRARSAGGAWGEFAPEIEHVTAYPIVVPDPPTAPTVTGKLGAVRVAWDGNLVDDENGAGAPERGFAYVYAAYCSTKDGVYTPAGANMGNAGFTPVTGLTIGTAYWFALFAVNTVGVVSERSEPTQFTVVGVKGPDIEANSVTANTIAAGAITAEKIDLGTVPVNRGNPVNRVPQPPTDDTYWAGVIAGTTPGFTYRGDGRSTATDDGIVIGAGGNGGTRLSLTARLAAPSTGKLNLRVLVAGSAATYTYVLCLNSSGASIGSPYGIANGEYSLPAGTTAYEVFVANFDTGGASSRIVGAQVFEVIGGGGTGQAAELSPAGLRLFDNNGLLAIDLSTASKNYLSIVDNTTGAPTAVATIEADGDATFSQVSADGFDIDGQDLAVREKTDRLWPSTLTQSNPNGSAWIRGDATDADGSPLLVPLLDRLARGPIYDVTWQSLNGFQLQAQYIRIAQDQFTLEDGRQYLFDVQLGGLQMDNTEAGDPGSGNDTLGVNCYVELQVNTAPNQTIQDGQVIGRAVVHNNQRGYFSIPASVWTASSQVSAIDTANRLLPAGVPIYWQVNFNMSVAPKRKVNLAEFGYNRGLTILDVGSAYATRPGNGADGLVDTTDRTTSGASSGSTSGGTSASSKTVKIDASWSRSYADGGATALSGSGQYTNQKLLYQGLGQSAMGAKIGFAPSDLAKFAGRTITGMQLYLKNRYIGVPSAFTALLGTHGDSGAPGSYTGGRANGWNVRWSPSDSKYISIPQSLWAGFANGSLKGFTLGVSGDKAQYGYFAGANQDFSPVLKVTYH